MSETLDFLVGQLDHVEAQIFEVEYAPITYPKVLPISTEAGETAESIKYQSIDKVGQAKFIGKGVTDIPLAEIGGSISTVGVEMGGLGYEYTDFELMQAQILNRSIDTLRGMAVRQGIEEHIQSVFMLGDTDVALPGFINNAAITANTVVNGAAGTPAFTTKTPDEILADINTLFTNIWVNSSMVERADTLALPPAQLAYLNNTRVSQTSDTTILEFLLAKVMWLNSMDNVVPLNELVGAGAGATDRMVAYTKNPIKVVAHMPMPIKQLQPVRKDLGWRIPMIYRISGVEFRYPGSAEYADGI